MAEIESIISRGNDLKEINDTLYSISERLKYYFTCLTMEDNFSPEVYLSYREKNGLIAALQVTEYGIQSDYINLQNNTSSSMKMLADGIELSVTKGDVTNSLNLGTEALTITGNKLIVTGGNFTLDESNNVKVKGNITATSGKIAGWDITSNGVMDGGNTARIKCGVFNNSNDILMNEIYVVDVPGKSDLSYCDLTGAGTKFHVDENTVFLDGFTADNLVMAGKIHCGILVSYFSVDCDSQIVATNCYTKRTGTTWSDSRLKKDIVEISGKESDYMMKHMNPCRYKLKDTESYSCGFIAQDIDMIQRSMGTDYGLTGRAGEYMTLNYDGMITFLMKMIQEQTEEINALSRRGTIKESN